MGEVLIGAASIRHDVEISLRRSVNDQIIDDAPRGVGEQGQGALVLPQAPHVGDRQGLDELDPVSPPQVGL